MTVRETLDFSGRCLGVGPRYKLLTEILKTEKEAVTKLDPNIDAFMNASTFSGRETNLITDYVLKVCYIDSNSCFVISLLWSFLCFLSVSVCAN